MFKFSSLLTSEELSVLRKLANKIYVILRTLYIGVHFHTHKKILYRFIASLFTLYLLPRYLRVKYALVNMYAHICKSVAE